ncbi:glycoside hydrolase family 10 protein [Ascidiimonas sp. W6]|uniref:glycoside hydrolase family 10 protein n=1 Tax=Ascidiimonas meishanensis TaxID=3128903 RepID=UPI0030EE0F19
MFKKLILISLLSIFISCGSVLPENLRAPKTEFRGVWIATVVNIDWPASGADDLIKKKTDFLKLLDFYQQLHFNAAIIQIRTAGDAFYPSEFAPWSRFLTGKEGASSPDYEHLLPWMIEETHKRGMEFHAWLNPYRATFDLNTNILSDTHDFNTHPEWMVKYGKKYYYNPGLPDVQNHLLNIINEVVENYDIDAIHFDDYFYPYTIKGEVFNDLEAYQNYAGEGMSIEEWRRDNINILIKNTHAAIKAQKPWVTFGISPFGVWRNASKDPLGSDTRAGQTTYDDLYADALKWIKNGWIDYIAPQLYWSLHYPPASHSKLIDWWSKNTKDTQLYIGNGPYKIRNNADKAWKKKKELPKQLSLARTTAQVDGNIFFSAKSLTEKNKDVVKHLKRKYYKYPALTPPKKKDPVAFDAPTIKKASLKNGHYRITLTHTTSETPYLIFYGFKSKRAINLKTGKNILTKTYLDTKKELILDQNLLKHKKIFAISYLNKYGQESKPFLFTFKEQKDGSLSIYNLPL